MQAIDDVGDQVASRGEPGDAAPAEVYMQCVVCDCGEGVAAYGGEEDERHRRVGEPVVLLELVESATYIHRWKYVHGPLTYGISGYENSQYNST